MKYILSALLLLSSCAHSKQSVQDLSPLENRIKHLEWQTKTQGFAIEQDKCFINFLMCRTKGATYKQCWGPHEQCVINTYKAYKAVQ